MTLTPPTAQLWGETLGYLTAYILVTGSLSWLLTHLFTFEVYATLPLAMLATISLMFGGRALRRYLYGH